MVVKNDAISQNDGIDIRHTIRMYNAILVFRFRYGSDKFVFISQYGKGSGDQQVDLKIENNYLRVCFARLI